MMIKVPAKDVKPGDVIAGMKAEIVRYASDKLIEIIFSDNGTLCIRDDSMVSLSREEEVAVKLTRTQCDMISAVFYDVVSNDDVEAILDKLDSGGGPTHKVSLADDSGHFMIKVERMED